MSPEHSSQLRIEFPDPAAAWRPHLPETERLCARAAQAALAAAAPALGEAEIAIALAEDAAMRGLNRDWRGQDKPTNVLSFPAPRAPAGEGPVLLGDIVLAYETIAREAAEQEKRFADHVAHLVVHGTLHLLGHDHVADDDASRMESLETAILAQLGVADPYAAREPADG